MNNFLTSIFNVSNTAIAAPPNADDIVAQCSEITLSDDSISVLRTLLAHSISKERVVSFSKCVGIINTCAADSKQSELRLATLFLTFQMLKVGKLVGAGKRKVFVFYGTADDHYCIASVGRSLCKAH